MLTSAWIVIQCMVDRLGDSSWIVNGHNRLSKYPPRNSRCCKAPQSVEQMQFTRAMALRLSESENTSTLTQRNCFRIVWINHKFAQSSQPVIHLSTFQQINRTAFICRNSTVNNIILTTLRMRRRTCLGLRWWKYKQLINCSFEWNFKILYMNVINSSLVPFYDSILNKHITNH